MMDGLTALPAASGGIAVRRPLRAAIDHTDRDNGG